MPRKKALSLSSPAPAAFWGASSKGFVAGSSVKGNTEIAQQRFVFFRPLATHGFLGLWSGLGKANVPQWGEVWRV
jgi:hypothetical protein